MLGLKHMKHCIVMAHSALPGPGVLAVPSHQRGTEIVNGKLFLISFQMKNIAALSALDKEHNYSLTSLKPTRDVEKGLENVLDRGTTLH